MAKESAMVLKLMLMAAVLLGLYKMAGGKLPFASKTHDIAAKEEDDGDTLVECSRCGTYVVKKEAIFFRGRYYCSRECLPG